MKTDKTKIVASLKLSRVEKMRTNCKKVQKGIMILSNCKTDSRKHSLQKSIKDNAYEKQV